MKKERIIELIDEHLEEPNSMSKEWAKALRKIRGKFIKKQSAFPWEDFIAGKVAVHCDTEEKAKEFLKACARHGLKWSGGSDCTKLVLWERYKENTCYAAGINYCYVEWYEKEGLSIIEYPVLEKKQSADKPLTINRMVKEAHETAKEHGWWDEERSFGEQIALIHSELSEALEEARKGMPETRIDYLYAGEGYLKKVEGIPIELADAVIRIADLCGHYNIDLDKAIKIKMEYNKTREYKHGKVF